MSFSPQLQEALAQAALTMAALDDFVAATHAAKGFNAVQGAEWAEMSWEQKVETVQDYHGFMVAELYSTVGWLVRVVQLLVQEFGQEFGERGDGGTCRE